MDAARLHELILQVAPIDGVSIGDPADKTTWKVTFRDATPAQIASARSVIDAFDGSLPPDPISQWDIVSFKIAFNHENRIRALEGKAAITAAQFKNALSAIVN